MGSEALCTGLYGPCANGAGDWFALPAVSQTCSQCMLDSSRALSPVLFIIFMDRISKRSQGPEGVWFRSRWISSLLFADDVVLLAPSSQDLQHVLGRFAAECEAAGMRISTSKSEAMVLDRKKVACPLWVWGELLPHVEEFKYLGVLFASKGRMERETDRWISAAATVMRSLYRSGGIGPKGKALDLRVNLHSYEMSFFCRLEGHSLGDKVRSSVTREELLLHIERSQLRWLGHQLWMPPGRLP